MPNEKDICLTCAVRDKCPCRKCWRSNNPICDCSGYVEEKTEPKKETITDKIRNDPEIQQAAAEAISDILNYAIPKISGIVSVINKKAVEMIGETEGTE